MSAEPAIISDTIDDRNEKITFQDSYVKIWRYDKISEKYRERGRGELTIYYDIVRGLAKIVFINKLNLSNKPNENAKTRLLQYIIGKSNCYLERGAFTAVTWIGTDYAWAKKPIRAKWRLLFMKDGAYFETTNKFMRIFNFYIDTPNKRLTLKDIKKVDQNVKDIISGYIREIETDFEEESKFYNIPILLNYLCLMYYHDPLLYPDT